MFFNPIGYVCKNWFGNKLERSNCSQNRKIISIGIDLICISRIERLIAGYDNKTLELLFTPREIERCSENDNSPYIFALYFGLKEAVAKALTTGLVGIDWDQIEINLTNEREPIHLTGMARVQSYRRNIEQWHIDWWQLDNDTDAYLLIRVIATGKKNIENCSNEKCKLDSTRFF